MTLQKTIAPLVLLMFTVVFALPAAPAAVIPSAIAQEEDEDNLASGTVSNVLDNVNSAGDSTNTQLSVPITDQDQTNANFGLSGALDVTVERTLSPEEEEEEPPEEDGVFCLQTLTGQIFCFDTSEECETAEGLLVVQTGCDEFETPPAGAISCSIVQGKIECIVI